MLPRASRVGGACGAAGALAGPHGSRGRGVHRRAAPAGRGRAHLTTIVVAAGTYQLTAPLYINGTFTNVGIRGATGNRDDVVIVVRGMTGSNDGGVPFGIWVGGDVRGVTIAHLTIRDVFNHPIILNVRHNLFRNIRAPQGQLAGPAILMWNHSTTSVVDGNTFINCQREIALGLIQRTPDGHVGDIVRNNFVYRSAASLRRHGHRCR